MLEAFMRSWRANCYLIDYKAAMKTRVGSLPVFDGNRLQGLLTARDIAVRLVGLDSATTKVRDLMTPEISYCFEDQTLEEAAALKEAHRIRRLPILSRDKSLIGMLSLGDWAVCAQTTEDFELADKVLEDVFEPSEPVVSYFKS